MITNIDEIKARADIVDIISSEVTLKKRGPNMVGLCPFHDEKTPSFTVGKGIFKCFGCGKSGDSIAFLMDHKQMNYIQAIKFISDRYNIPVQEETKSYERPLQRLEKLQPDTIKYFETRGISNNTLLRFGITEATEWMPDAKKETRVICFNYIRDGELVNIKFRGKGRDFKLAKNAELIFYNLDAIQGDDTAVIVEGEIDALSLHEAGIYNVVSVPNGASTGVQQLKYLDNCWSAFEGKSKIILLTDNDTPGISLRDELARRLGKGRCYKTEYPPDCKDANDILLKHGKQMIAEIIEAAKPWPIEGVLGVNDLSDKLEDYYLNGYPEGLKAGIGEFDELLSFSGGQLTVITGSPGSGKSEFIDYISVQLSKLYHWKWGVCSFENPAVFHASKLMEKYTGLSFNFRKDPSHRMNRQEFNDGMLFIDDHFSFINISVADITIQGILSKMAELVLRNGIKGVVIDPWNHIEHKVPPGQTETQYISESLTLIKDFALKTDTHVFLVAHPRKLTKPPGSNQYPIATMYDIAGSAHFFNKTDNGISIHRDFSNEVVTAYVQKVRFAWMGRIGFAAFKYDTFTRQYSTL